MNIAFEGRRVAFWSAGAGAPALCVHGSLATSATWRRTAANLESSGVRLIALDLPVVRGLQERNAGSRVLEIAGANHFMIFTHPVETARVIRESLST